jgi:eukaryotic-like serine/threonine-protein kinase
LAAREHDYNPGDTIRGDGAEYLVQAVLGSGGMGAVYLVKDKNIGRLFVLKVLHQSLAHRRDLIERFEVEARALGHLSHPGIIEIFQLNRTRDDKQMPYYLMEVLTGESLADSLRRHGKLDLFTALGIATKLLHALDHAHERGIVHRDIKPDNIFLHRGSSSEPVVKLLDFGILKLVASEENPGIFIGTPRYCAPEQLQAGPSIGPKADLYAVGVVLFQMLTGHLPFEGYGGSLGEMVQTLSVPAPSLTKHEKFPPALVALVASALAKEPDKRPADAFTFASELRKIRRDFAPDREDPHTHVTAEVIAEPGRPQRDASQITSAHLAAPTSPDEDMGRLMDALRGGEGGEGAAVADVLREGESQPSVSITGFESTAKDPAAVPGPLSPAPLSPARSSPALLSSARSSSARSSSARLSSARSSPAPLSRAPLGGKPEVQRDAVTALPRSGASEGAPGSIRYVTKEAPHVDGAAAIDAPPAKAVIHRTVPMARPRPVHHYTEPMAGRPGRFAHPVANDARTPEPHAIDNPKTSRSAPSPARALARMRRHVERVVPLRALPVALALGIFALVAGMFLLRTKGVDLSAPPTAPAAAAAPVQTETSEAPAPVTAPSPTAATITNAESTVTPDAGGGAAARVAITSASSTPTVTPTQQPPRASLPRVAAPTASPVGAPAKKRSSRPADIGFE